MHLTGEKELPLEMTRLSERGQIVIPTELRKSMHLKEGERFVIMGLDDTIILRKLESLGGKNSSETANQGIEEESKQIWLLRERNSTIYREDPRRR